MNYRLFRVATVLLLVLTHETAAQEALLLPVPANPIYPGQSLDEANFKLKLFNVWEQSRLSYVLDKGQLAGKEAVRTLSAGKPVALQSIRSAEDVKKGVPTKAVFSSGAIEIQGVLLPLTGGIVGQTVQARNAASGRIVSTLIMDDGTLLVVGK